MNRKKLMPTLAVPVDRGAIAPSIQRDRSSVTGSPVEPSNSRWGWAGTIAKNSLFESLNNLYPRYNHCDCLNAWPTGETHPRAAEGYGYMYGTNCNCY